MPSYFHQQITTQMLTFFLQEYGCFECKTENNLTFVFLIFLENNIVNNLHV